MTSQQQTTPKINNKPSQGLKHKSHARVNSANNKTNKPTGGWKSDLSHVLYQHNKATASGGKASGHATQALRKDVLFQGFNTLLKLGYRFRDVHFFKERHMTALAQHWEATGLAPATIQNRISIFRVFSEWIGKAGMIRDAKEYVKDPTRVERHLVAQTDKTWSGQQKNLPDKLTLIQAKETETSAHIAIQLELQRAFALRMKEAALLVPHMADKGTYLAVNWGTKGGRARVVPIQTDYQRAVLERAKALCSKPNQSLIPMTFNFIQWKNHYYYILRSSGISRQEGITGHGLRHERLNEVYQEIAGEKSPIKGGNRHRIDKALESAARQEVAEIAGHSRESIASAYVGGKQINTVANE